MASFKSTALNSYASLTATLARIPLQNREHLQQLSTVASDCITSAAALHIYEISAEPDDLLFLTVQIEWLKNRVTYVQRQHRERLQVPAGAVILASLRHRSFGRVTEQLEHLTGDQPQRHLNGHVALFNSVAVVRTIDPFTDGDDVKAQKTATKAITLALQKLSKATHTSEYVWHHGTYVPFLNFFIDNTHPNIRNALVAITLRANIEALPNGTIADAHNNTSDDFRRLERYARRLEIPIVLIDKSTIPLRYEYLNHILKNFGEIVPALFPASVYTESVYHFIDIAHVCVYRLLAASAHRHTTAVASKCADAIPTYHDGLWAKACVKPAAYPPDRCTTRRALPAMKELAWYTDMGMLPTASPTQNTSALARLLLGPGRPTNFTLCVPVELAFRSHAFRVASNAVFHVYTLDPFAVHAENASPEAAYHAHVTSAVLSGVEAFVKAFYARSKNRWGYTPQGVGRYPDGLAVVWGEVYQGLIQVLRKMGMEREGKRWSEAERKDVQSVIQALGTGGFTTAVVGVLRAREKRGKGNGRWISG